MPKIRSWLSLAAKIGVAILLMTYLVRSGHLDLASLARLMTPFNVFVGLTLVGINTVLLTWRWLFLLRARGFDPKISYVASLYLIGMFFNFALPGAVGGDFVKGFYISRDHKERRTDAVFSILIDRVLGLYTFFMLTLLAVAFDFEFVMGHPQIRWVAISCFTIFMCMTLFFVAAFSTRLQRWLGIPHLVRLSPRLRIVVRTLEVFREFGSNRKVICASVAVSLLSQIAMLYFFYFVGLALGETDVSWRAYLFAVPMGYLATALPIAPAGVGVGQVAFKYLFEAYLGRPTPLGTISITAAQLAVFVYAIFGAFFYIRYRKPNDRKDMYAS